MSLRAQLMAQLRRYDEEAFVALANRGLLRRAGKDLEAGQPQVAEDTGEALVIAFGGQRVRFDARGPAHAACSCPTSGVCQHILAAALWLQRQEDEVGEPPPGDGEAVPAHPDADMAGDAAAMEALHAGLLHFSADELIRHAGKAGYRWAWQFVLDLDAERELRIGGERNVAIGFRQPAMTFRYLGGGLDNLIADVSLARIEKYRVAAVLAYQQAHGIQIAPLPETRAATPRDAQLDLGKDHELPEGAGAAQGASQARLRQAVRRLLAECVQLGLAHLSPDIQQRFSTLAVWAQGARYYRLAMLLRRLADHVELLLERAGGADEHRLFEEASIAFALVCALEAAQSRGEMPAHLVGRARHAYQTAHALELLGLGALPWRSASGYLGLTMLFWSPADRAFLSCSDARPESQRAGFNPVARYRAPGPWQGLGSPAQATGQRLHLREAQVSAAGRLSGSEKTLATVQPLDAARLAALLDPCDDWSALKEARASSRRSVLAEPLPMQDWVVLKPARFGTPAFDAARQILVWPLHDQYNQRLDAEIPYSDLNQPAIERVEALAGESLPGGTLVVARLRDGSAALVAEPLSLIRPDAPGCPVVDALYFDAAPRAGALATTVGKLRGMVARRPASPPTDPGGAAASPALLDVFRAWLMQQAERGIGAHLGAQVTRELQGHVERLRNAGLTAFECSAPDQELAVVLLRAHYVLMQYGKLFGASVDAESGIAGSVA